MAGPSVSISSPTVRIVHSPKGVYQTSKTCHNIPSDTQYSSPHIFGRYSNSGFRYKNIKRTNRSGFRSFAKPGFHNKLRKICTDSFPCHGISRTSSRLQNYDVLSTVTQGDKNNRTMQVSTSKQNCLAARACPVNGVSRIDTASCMAGSAAFQPSSILSDTTARSKQGFLRRPRVSPIASKERTSMVDFQYHRVNGSLIHPPSCEITIMSDASKLGWGAACGLQTTKGSWSSQERSFHINVLELKAAFLAIQAFLKHKTNISIKLRLNHTTAVYYINNKGGTSSPELMALTMELWTWCLSRNIYIQAEHLPGVQNCLADKASRTCINSTDWKIQPKLIKQFLVDGHRPLRYEADAPVTTLRQLAPRSESHRSRCIFSKLGNFEGLCLSPVQSNTTNTHQSSERQNRHCPSGPSVARADLVAFTASTGIQSASSPTFNTRNTEEPHRSNNDASNVPTATSSRLACFQRSRSTVGLPEHVTRLLSASVRKSTNKTYDSSWRKWNSWCDRRQIDPISAGLNNVLTFLSEQFKNNLQYRTVNVLRSAISSTHQLVNTLWLLAF